MRILDRLFALDPRLLLMGMAATLALIAVQSWILFVKTPASEYRKTKLEAGVLEKTLADSPPFSEEIGKLDLEVKTLEQRLQAVNTTLAADQLLVSVVGELDRIASRHNVVLASVKPDSEKAVVMFDEMPFAIELRGEFLPLTAWLHTVESELDTLAITQFGVRRTPDSLTANLRIAAYRLSSAKGNRP